MKRRAIVSRPAGTTLGLLVPPIVGLHHLRHRQATMLLAAGTYPKVVSERLGHSGISLTLDTALHVMPGMQNDASETIDRRLFG